MVEVTTRHVAADVVDYNACELRVAEVPIEDADDRKAATTNVVDTPVGALEASVERPDVDRLMCAWIEVSLRVLFVDAVPTNMLGYPRRRLKEGLKQLEGWNADVFLDSGPGGQKRHGKSYQLTLSDASLSLVKREEHNNNTLQNTIYLRFRSG